MASRVRTEAACLKSLLGERGAAAFEAFEREAARLRRSVGGEPFMSKAQAVREIAAARGWAVQEIKLSQVDDEDLLLPMPTDNFGISKSAVVEPAPADYARVRCAAPMGLRHRISPDSAWPLRCADGRTFAERKASKS